MNKSKLYLDVDGVFINRLENEDKTGGAGFKLAHYAKHFLRRFSYLYDCVWLTDRSHDGDIRNIELAFEHAVDRRSGRLHDDEELMSIVRSIPAARWEKTKASVLSAKEKFYWIDSRPDEASRKWLDRHGLHDRLIEVSTDEYSGDLIWALDVLMGFKYLEMNVAINEITMSSDGDQLQYQIAGGDRETVEEVGNKFVEVWEPDFSPSAAFPNCDKNGVWRLDVSRSVEADPAAINKAELVERVIESRCGNTCYFDKDGEFVDAPLEPEKALLYSLKPVEAWEIEALLKVEIAELSEYRNPTVLFREIGDNPDVSSSVGGPIQVAGYYVDPICDPGCCRPVGPFNTPGHASASVYLSFEKDSSR
jgi:hypothetical protein